MELVSNKYDPAKWERALTACKEALTAAEAAGYKLFDLEASEAKAAIDKVPLPFIPGKEEDTEENELFKKQVRMLQYMITAHEGFSNKEIIWAINPQYADGNERMMLVAVVRNRGFRTDLSKRVTVRGPEAIMGLHLLGRL